jgi:glycosyltransferase involved in cell wall biosynthesis
VNILWAANTPWAHTGYGTQTRHILPRLSKLGHRCWCFSVYGLEGGGININIDDESIQVLPRGRSPFGEDVFPHYIEKYQIDLVVTLFDLWVLPPVYHNFIKCPWAAWYPVDHQPLPLGVFNVAKLADYPVTYSAFGYEESKRAGLQSTYIPHGIDTTAFRPYDRNEARMWLGIEQDCYLASMVAANKGYPARKSFWESLQAFTLFRKAHPERSCKLYLHTDCSTAERGVDLVAMAKFLGIEKDTVYVKRDAFTEGLPEEYVARVYSASDVLLNPAMGEGFGLPIAEAQACGCPVVTLDFSSMTELTRNGIATRPVGTHWTPLNSLQAIASPQRVYQAMETLYARSAGQAGADATRGREFIINEYEWSNVIPRYWVPFLARVAEERIAQQETVAEPAAEPAMVPEATA